MVSEPPLRSNTAAERKQHWNPYQKRWGWWYSQIADWMLRNPGGSAAECAAALGKAENTISLIRNSDMFREYYARRREAYAAQHDQELRNKLHKVATRGLDQLLDNIEKKKDQIPMALMSEVTLGALDRLGYSPNKPQPVQVNVDQRDQRTQIAVSAEALEEARQALRAAQHKRMLDGEFDRLLPTPATAATEVEDGEGAESVRAASPSEE